MTAAETANLVGSLVALAGSAAFVVVYTHLARGWWRSLVGRLLVGKALMIAMFMALTLSVYLFDADLAVFRWVRGVLAGLFGLAMFRQTSLVVRAQRPADQGE